MKRNHLRYLSALILLLGGCSGSPASVAEEYLQAIQAGNVVTAQKLFCHRDGFSAAEFQTIIDYSITESKEIEPVPGAPVTVIAGEGTYSGIATTLPIKFELWISSPKAAIRLAENTNQELAQLGVTPTPVDPKSFTGPRPCITQALLLSGN